MSNWKTSSDSQEVVDFELKERIDEPSKYHVFLLNDDYTPMDFVTDVLKKFFNMGDDQATDIMLTIHYKGKALCGTYSADVAETKVDHVERFALENQHPLKCAIEEA